jgi:hypothetical protein
MSTALVSEWTTRVNDPRLAVVELERSGLLLHVANDSMVGEAKPSRRAHWLSAFFHTAIPAIR